MAEYAHDNGLDRALAKKNAEVQRLRAHVAAADDLAAACAIFVPSGPYGTAVMDRLARLTSFQQADAFVKIRAQLEAYLASRAP